MIIDKHEGECLHIENLYSMKSRYFLNAYVLEITICFGVDGEETIFCYIILSLCVYIISFYRKLITIIKLPFL